MNSSEDIFELRHGDSWRQRKASTARTDHGVQLPPAHTRRLRTLRPCLGSHTVTKAARPEASQYVAPQTDTQLAPRAAERLSRRRAVALLREPDAETGDDKLTCRLLADIAAPATAEKQSNEKKRPEAEKETPSATSRDDSHVKSLAQILYPNLHALPIKDPSWKRIAGQAPHNNAHTNEYTSGSRHVCIQPLRMHSNMQSANRLAK